MVSVKISSAGKPLSLARGLPITVEVKDDAKVSDVKAAIAAKFPKLYVSRQKLTPKGERKALEDDTLLKDVDVGDGDELFVKDLGAQISWRAVFVVEYIGPLILHPIFYWFPQVFYGQPVEHSEMQKFAYALVMLHFLKRELETLFLHRFSHGTMPFVYIFRNSAHYHILAGLFLAVDLYRPGYSSTSPNIQGTIYENIAFLWGCVAVWLFAEFSNFLTHLNLRSLRPEGSRKRVIPHGYGFDWVSLPNYFFEILGWAAFTVMTGSWASVLFLAVGTGTMANWAMQKHRKYKKEFGSDYPRNRKIMIPFI
ncbi:3-oxo-5-alpha-steroid 4-dehydrogenase-domain-containing protein, partial [Thelephora terrestris]